MTTKTMTPAGVTTARLSELSRLETAVSVMTEVLHGDTPDTHATITWLPRSLRETPPGEVRLTLKLGSFEVSEAAPCVPAGPEDRGPKVAEERQLGLRSRILQTMLRRLAATAKAAPKTKLKTLADGDEVPGSVVADAAKKVLRVAKAPITIGELSKRSGYPIERLRTVLPGMRRSKFVEPKGTVKGVTGHQENLWVITEKGLTS